MFGVCCCSCSFRDPCDCLSPVLVWSLSLLIPKDCLVRRQLCGLVWSLPLDALNKIPAGLQGKYGQAAAARREQIALRRCVEWSPGERGGSAEAVGLRGCHLCTLNGQEQRSGFANSARKVTKMCGRRSGAAGDASHPGRAARRMEQRRKEQRSIASCCFQEDELSLMQSRKAVTKAGFKARRIVNALLVVEAERRIGSLEAQGGQGLPPRRESVMEEEW